MWNPRGVFPLENFAFQGWDPFENQNFVKSFAINDFFPHILQPISSGLGVISTFLRDHESSSSKLIWIPKGSKESRNQSHGKDRWV